MTAAPRKLGLRDLATLRTRASTAAPANRAQAVSRFALLENEKARLLREIDNWSVRKVAAELMLTRVETELASLAHHLLSTEPVPAPVGPVRIRRTAVAASAAPAPSSTATLEY